MSLTQSIRQKLETEFRPVHFELVNESHQHAGPREAETHFKLVLVSPVFEGLGRLERQRRVMSLLTAEREQGLHALTMRVMTPAEWNQVKDQFEMVSPPCHGGSKHDNKG